MSSLQSELPHFPDGWYFLARSDEVSTGRVLTRRLAGEDVVLFRASSGALGVTRPHCPHLGAHLGHGGRVEGEELRCPMHGFCYDASGRCTRSGYPNSKPPKTRLELHRFVERNDLILVWHSSNGQEPTWDVPARDVSGYSSLRTRTFAFKGHPQETTENSVDLGHLDRVHSFFDVEMTAPLHTDGPYLRASFAFSRRAGFFGRRDALRAFYTAHVHGLGYSHVDVDVPAFGLKTHQYVFATPTDPGHVALTIGMRATAPARAGAINPLARLLPGRLARELVNAAIMVAYAREVGHDVAIWEHKRYRPQPGLAQGDGPIGPYRRWARQFYGSTPQAGERVAL